jgi:hypothetical protein
VERAFDPLPIDAPVARSLAEIVADAGRRNEGTQEGFRNTLPAVTQDVRVQSEALPCPPRQGACRPQRRSTDAGS